MCVCVCVGKAMLEIPFLLCNGFFFLIGFERVNAITGACCQAANNNYALLVPVPWRNCPTKSDAASLVREWRFAALIVPETSFTQEAFTPKQALKLSSPSRSCFHRAKLKGNAPIPFFMVVASHTCTHTNQFFLLLANNSTGPLD